MLDRIKAAVDAKTDADFIVMARTDALAVDGFDAVIHRVAAFEEAGADAIFAEAMTDLDLYRRVVAAVNIPVLANITEFGQTPPYSRRSRQCRHRDGSVSAVGIPRRECRGADGDQAIRGNSQQSVVPLMQTRMELYDCLGYHDYERKLDELFANENERETG
jgi:methylisocitrate lyase